MAENTKIESEERLLLLLEIRSAERAIVLRQVSRGDSMQPVVVVVAVRLLDFLHSPLGALHCGFQFLFSSRFISQDRAVRFPYSDGG